MQEALRAHLKTGSTTVCRAWLVRRKDGVEMGFVDHDEDLRFDRVVFSARTGLTAHALQQTTGMSVDNTEAAGAISDAGIREEDILAGRYDGAEVTSFLVNWANVAERSVLFRGTFGEMTRSDGAFRVELRGLTQRLNTPTGHAYHAGCSAALGDRRCRVDMTPPDRAIEAAILEAKTGRIFQIASMPELASQWFARGVARVVTGEGKGQSAMVRFDEERDGVRGIELWQAFGQWPKVGDVLRLETGCDKRAATCREKFSNFINFRGFPHIPGEDWQRSNPAINGRR